MESYLEDARVERATGGEEITDLIGNMYYHYKEAQVNALIEQLLDEGFLIEIGWTLNNSSANPKPLRPVIRVAW